MKKILGILSVAVVLFPSLAFSDAISVRAGYFIPRAGSELWTTEFSQMSYRKSDFQNTTLGFFYERFLSREISLVLGVEGYNQNRGGAYLDYVGYSFDEGDFALPSDYEGEFTISHAFHVSITPIQASLKLTPLGRRSGFIPYVGAGVSLYIWSVKMQGDMVDFEDDSWVYEDPDYGEVQIYPIYLVDVRDETQVNFGFQAFAGIMIPFAARIAFEAEVKYNFGKGGLEDFEDFDKFDLGGLQISLGINYWF